MKSIDALPDLDQPAEVEELVEFKVWIESHVELDRLRRCRCRRCRVDSIFGLHRRGERRRGERRRTYAGRPCQTAYRRPGRQMSQAARRLRRQQLPAKGRANRRGQLQKQPQAEPAPLVGVDPAGWQAQSADLESGPERGPAEETGLSAARQPTAPRHPRRLPRRSRLTKLPKLCGSISTAWTT